MAAAHVSSPATARAAGIPRATLHDVGREYHSAFGIGRPSSCWSESPWQSPRPTQWGRPSAGNDTCAAAMPRPRFVLMEVLTCRCQLPEGVH